MGCFAFVVSLMSHDCCVALPRDAMALSVVCECGIRLVQIRMKLTTID